MSKPIKITLIALCALCVTALLAFYILVKSVGPNIPKPVSDVPIEYKIGWWSAQEGLVIEKLETVVIFDELNLFNSKALVEYSISGHITYKNGWRPNIKSVYLSERWLSPAKDVKTPIGDIQIIPIVELNSDANYMGEKVNFSIKVQDYLSAGDWGNNIFKVTSLSQQNVIELNQEK
jgi:hypothetical protein